MSKSIKTFYLHNHIVYITESKGNPCPIHQHCHDEIKRHRIHFELYPHKNALTICIRGSHPCCIAEETLDLVNKVIEEWYYNVNVDITILCPK